MAKVTLSEDFKCELENMLSWESGSVDINKIVDLMLLHGLGEYEHDKLVSQHYKRKARGILARLKDDKGKRLIFALKGNKGHYINIDKCNNIDMVEAVLAQLQDKIDGLTISKGKAQEKYKQLEGQLDLFSISADR